MPSFPQLAPGLAQAGLRLAKLWSMSAFNIREFALTQVASILMRALEEVPDWEGPAKTDFDRRLNEILHRLEEAAGQLDLAYITETVAETVAVLL